MNEIIIALLSLLGTIVGSLSGVLAANQDYIAMMSDIELESDEEEIFESEAEQ